MAAPDGPQQAIQAFGDSDSDPDLQQPDVEELHGHPAVSKWWFVPDEEIEAFVSDRSCAEGFRYKKRDSGKSPSSSRATGTISRVGASAMSDTVDHRLRTQGRSSVSREAGKKDWMVPDEAIQDLITSMSLTSKSPKSAASLSLAGTMDLPMSVVQSARRSQSINIWIFFVDSEDSMRLTVSPWLRVGPRKVLPDSDVARASTPKSEPAVASGGGRCSLRWNSGLSQSLKGMIEELAEIEISRQKLSFHQCPLSGDEQSLRSYGIGDGDKLFCRIDRHRFHAQAQLNKDFNLTCTQRASSPRDITAGKYESWSLLNSKHIKDCRSSQGSVYMQPKWVIQQGAGAFSQVGSSVDVRRSHRPRPEAWDRSVWIKDRNDINVRAVRLRTGLAK